MTGSKVARFLTVALLIILLVSLAIVGGLALFGQGARSKVAASLFQKSVQPVATVLLTALYYWSEYLKPGKASFAVAESGSEARSGAVSSAAPQINLSVNNIQNVPSPPVPINIDELAVNVAKKIAENRETTAASVVAEKFVLVDAEGKQRAQLGLSGSGAAGLWAFDTEGRQRLWVGVGDKQEPILSLISRSGVTRLGIVDTETVCGIVIKRNDGKSLMNIIANSTESHPVSGIVLYDPSNEQSMSAIVQGRLTPGILFYKDKDGKTVWAYPPLRVGV
jgi:hypothetical protein